MSNNNSRTVATVTVDQTPEELAAQLTALYANVNGATLSAPGDFSLTFGASNITVTLAATVSISGGVTVFLEIDERGNGAIHNKRSTVERDARNATVDRKC